MSEANVTDRLLTAATEFLTPLRMGEGFNAEKFEAFCDALGTFAAEWKDKDVLPKSAASLFVDAHTAMVASSYLYPSQQVTIQQHADRLNDLIRGCCV